MDEPDVSGSQPTLPLFGPDELPPAPAPAAPVAVVPTSAWTIQDEQDPAYRARPWRRRHWRFLALVALVAVLVVSVAGVTVVVVLPMYNVANDILQRSRGELTYVNFKSVNGSTTFSISAAPGVNRKEATRLACEDVGPALAHDGFATASFAIYDPAGDLLASSDSTCTNAPTPTPVQNA